MNAGNAMRAMTWLPLRLMLPRRLARFGRAGAFGSWWGAVRAGLRRSEFGQAAFFPMAPAGDDRVPISLAIEPAVPGSVAGDMVRMTLLRRCASPAFDESGGLT